LHCDGDLFHVRCVVRVINLIVKDGLQSIEGVISDIRELVKSFAWCSNSMELVMWHVVVIFPI
jgi:hypothetical protein